MKPAPHSSSGKQGELETLNSKHFYRRRPPIMRSIDACPPPEISKDRAMPRKAIASSIPAGAKKAGQRTPKIATSITQVIRKAPTRVNNPTNTRTPPMSSDSAAAPIHNHAGRMNGNGAGKDVNFANPGPLNEPRTFWAPCPMKAIPRASRSGTGTHEEEVDVSLRNMVIAFRTLVVWIGSNYKAVCVQPPRKKPIRPRRSRLLFLFPPSPFGRGLGRGFCRARFSYAPLPQPFSHREKGDKSAVRTCIVCLLTPHS
jgi:hypothetical protein